MPKDKFCIECGYELPITAKFCESCGIELPGSESPSESKPINQTPKETTGKIPKTIEPKNELNLLDIIKKTSSSIFIPISVGGGIKTLKDIGFTYLDYGLEHWDRKILKNLGKGTIHLLLL